MVNFDKLRADLESGRQRKLAEFDELEGYLDSSRVPAGTLVQRVIYFAANKGSTDYSAVQAPASSEVVLSEDQQIAWEKLNRWIEAESPYFVLRGFAGTGKTFLMKMLLEKAAKSFKFTAPTNKAAKVLSQMLGTDASTIHSLLGLRMVPDEEGMRLEYPRTMPHISRSTVVVIDEASMVGRELHDFVDRARAQCGFRVLYVGDPAQLNPIGERSSPAWEVAAKEDRAMLRKVMRFDNQLLNLSLRIRKRMAEKRFVSPVRDDHDAEGGVFLLSQKKFDEQLASLKLEDFDTAKVVAWRNKTVARYNRTIRKQLGFVRQYEEGDVLLLGGPIEIDGKIVGHTDEEGRVESAKRTRVEVDGEDVRVWRIVLKTDDAVHTLNVPLDDDTVLPRILSEKAAAARNAPGHLRKSLWSDFWDTKKRFNTVRYGYAMTAHRVQGSTLDTAFVDQEDVLANQDKLEAMRCLYVACTRPRFRLYTF